VGFDKHLGNQAKSLASWKSTDFLEKSTSWSFWYGIYKLELLKSLWIETVGSYVATIQESFNYINRQDNIFNSYMAETIRRFLELI